MNTQQLLNLSLRDVNKMTDKELRQATSILRSTGRKRYERLVEKEMYSPAVESMRKSAKKGGTAIFPTVKDMDRAQLMNEFRRQKKFLEFKTSTITGTKEVHEMVRERAKETLGREFTDDEITEIWRITGKLQNMVGLKVLSKDKDTNGNEISNVVSEIIQDNPNLSEKDVIEYARQRIDEIYENETSKGIYTSRFLQ